MPLWRRVAEPLDLLLATLMAFGLINGGVLALLRLFDARLRAISVPDDYASMALSLAVIGLAIAALLDR